MIANNLVLTILSDKLSFDLQETRRIYNIDDVVSSFFAAFK